MLLALPEDDKTWTMFESSYQTLETVYALSQQQAQQLQAEGVRNIQLRWRQTVQCRRTLAAQAAAEIEEQRAQEAAAAAAEEVLRQQATAILNAKKMLQAAPSN